VELFDTSPYQPLPTYPYVYVWFTEEGAPYYVGKGRTNRAWRIGSPPRERIWFREFSSDSEALSVEAFLIDVFGLKNLSNKVRGIKYEPRPLPFSDPFSDLPFSSYEPLEAAKNVPIYPLDDLDYRENFAKLLDKFPRFLRTLTPRQERVVRLYFFEGKTVREIGQLFGTTHQRIQQIKEKALAKLREPARLNWIKRQL
jgi:RNA polymerase sigma factor (sigma-70 family)